MTCVRVTCAAVNCLPGDARRNPLLQRAVHTEVRRARLMTGAHPHEYMVNIIDEGWLPDGTARSWLDSGSSAFPHL